MATQTDKRRRKNKKLVIVGDGMCGKTCLLFAFKDKQFLSTHEPTIFETYPTEIQVDGKLINLTLFDTAGQEDYERLRALSYADTNIALICFSVDSPVSVISVIENWMPEVQEFCDRCPVILVACKIDLRTDSHTIEQLRRDGEKPISTETGKQIAERIKADAYMECSAKTREGVQDLFVHAARLSLKKRSTRGSNSRCVLY
ncbi:hypothetical protein I4U23_012478 [Adineta vaga]|nr:hypothetical protein I4U23_012478 [Adineta vaga]